MDKDYNNDGTLEACSAGPLLYQLASTNRLAMTSSFFTSQTVYLTSEASFLHWKSKLRNAWGQ